MKKVEIENRIQEIDDDKRDFFMVDLVIDEEKIDSGTNPISSHSFWNYMQQASQRALYRIKNENPTMNFDFNLSTMGMSEEQQEERFKTFIKGKYPELDVDVIFDVINNEVGEIQMTGPDDNHPNPFLKFSIESHFMKNFIVSVIDKLSKEK
jgi:hypothetical protein